jgi:hypothetical protein
MKQFIFFIDRILSGKQDTKIMVNKKPANYPSGQLSKLFATTRKKEPGFLNIIRIFTFSKKEQEHYLLINLNYDTNCR